MSDPVSALVPARSDPRPTSALRVTLFEDRAEVVRRGRAEIAAGVGWVAFGGVSPLADERTVQARVLSPGVQRVLRAEDPGCQNA